MENEICRVALYFSNACCVLIFQMRRTENSGKLLDDVLQKFMTSFAACE